MDQEGKPYARSTRESSEREVIRRKVCCKCNSNLHTHRFLKCAHSLCLNCSVVGKGKIKCSLCHGITSGTTPEQTVPDLLLPLDKTREYCIVVVGAGHSVAVRFREDILHKKYDPTLEDCYCIPVEIDSKACRLEIFDTAEGQEEYHALKDQYIKAGEGFVIVYGSESFNSFETAAKLRTSILRIKEDTPNVPIILVGKCDIESERAVTTHDGQRAAERWDTGFMECSTKTNKHVREVFFELVRRIDRWKEKHPEYAEVSRVSRRSSRRLSRHCVVS